MTALASPGSVVNWHDICKIERVSQQGMNFHIGGNYSVILMSVRKGAPYADRVENDGAILIYEGHNCKRSPKCKYPDRVDQPMMNPNKTLTQNGKFFKAAMRHKNHGLKPDLVRVYEKVIPGVWVYNGLFKLVDAWQEKSGRRKVFKFRLEISDEDFEEIQRTQPELEHTRMIPTKVKQAVWARDGGKCRLCGSTENLHFDHILPFSKGGTSLLTENIQLLCAKHNLQKRDKIE
ncbi:MAG TPA: YDG/SRA domain-containing protein [Smithellaceae bacterium]|nr:YDG/SRA domain-containing protein [Smithellaceae bacterium]